MLPRTCVVVPTYWTRAGGMARPGDAVYDHPTPLDGQGTVDALLRSLASLHDDFYLLLLVAVTSEDVAPHAEERVRRSVAAYPGLRTLVFGRRHLKEVYEWLEGRGDDSPDGFLALREYPAIRNLQLAVPLVLGSTSIVALDDDEIVNDPAFLRKATSPLGAEVDGARVDGLSGHYEQEDGGILLRIDASKAASPNIFDRKAAVMNAATEMLEGHPGELVETPFCFGGNMEFTDDLAASVGFDPGITRGEDIDYLINARMEGRTFFLRKDLRVLHRPPSGGSYKDASLSKLEQDIVRFIYEREKLRVSQQHPDLQSVDADQLMPYPGEFLGDALDADAIRALEAAGYADDPQAFVRKAQAGAPDRVERYLKFRRIWPRTMATLREAPALRDRLLREINGL